MKTKTGAGIPIEQRNPSEVTTIHGSHPVAPQGVAVYNPAFDVTPAELITGEVALEKQTRELSTTLLPYDMLIGRLSRHGLAAAN